MNLIAGLQEILGPKIFRHAVQMDKTLEVRGVSTFKSIPVMEKGANLSPHDTGWINRTDWTNVHLGSSTTLNTDSNVTHNLNAPLANLLVKLFVSTDGTDANSFEAITNIGSLSDGGSTHGVTVYQVDNNNIKLQTATNGILITQDSGAYLAIDIEDYYYKVKIWFLG